MRQSSSRTSSGRQSTSRTRGTADLHRDRSAQSRHPDLTPRASQRCSVGHDARGCLLRDREIPRHEIPDGARDQARFDDGKGKLIMRVAVPGRVVSIGSQVPGAVIGTSSSAIAPLRSISSCCRTWRSGTRCSCTPATRSASSPLRLRPMPELRSFRDDRSPSD